MYLSEELPGVCVREQVQGQGHYEKTNPTK